MLKLIGKKIFTILRSKMCLSKPISAFKEIIIPQVESVVREKKRLVEDVSGIQTLTSCPKGMLGFLLM